MPGITLNWESVELFRLVTEARRALAVAMIKDEGLAESVIAGLAAAGLKFDVLDLQVLPAAFDPAAFNVPTFKVTVEINSREDGEPWQSRDKVVVHILSGLRAWFAEASERSDLGSAHAVAALRTLVAALQVDGRECGCRVNIGSGEVVSSWGGLSHLGKVIN